MCGFCINKYVNLGSFFCPHPRAFFFIALRERGRVRRREREKHWCKWEAWIGWLSICAWMGILCSGTVIFPLSLLLTTLLLWDDAQTNRATPARDRMCLMGKCKLTKALKKFTWWIKIFKNSILKTGENQQALWVLSQLRVLNEADIFLHHLTCS